MLSIISFRFELRCDDSDMVRIGFWDSIVLEGLYERDLMKEDEWVDSL